MQVWKFPIRLPDLCVHIPQGAKVISAGVQGEDVVVWALVNPGHAMVKRRFAVYGTGHQIPREDQHLDFVGTVFMGPLVFHVFDAGESR